VTDLVTGFICEDCRPGVRASTVLVESNAHVMQRSLAAQTRGPVANIIDDVCTTVKTVGAGQ